MKPLIPPGLVKKYNVPVPRYTSYPTVPFWQEELDLDLWKQKFKAQFYNHNSREGISIYIHLPFCESLCTYCGCNKKITTNHSVELTYLEAIEKEWQLYLSLMKETPVIRELHLGGGTPTFFSPANLEKLLNSIFKRSIIHPRHEFSIEGHPNNTTSQHLETLYKLGFRRISYGVQDNDPDVQRIINRIQPVENVRKATEEARKAGFKSVNFDLIYGLPKQTAQSIERTINQTLELRPDRIAFYSYAHVPWTSRGQRLFNEDDLPSPEEKLQLYLLGKNLLMENGYWDIGMDHFALKGDDLFKAWKNKNLHRNFMGYTTQETSLMLGLGVSSISDAGIAFAQNDKTLHNYYTDIQNNTIPVKKGFLLNEEDLAFRQYILDISCRGETKFKPEHQELLEHYTWPVLRELSEDNLVSFDSTGVKVNRIGMNFLRNICKAFDLHLLRDSSRNMFSKAI